MTPPKSPPQHPHPEPPENLAGLGREGLLELPAPVTERQVAHDGTGRVLLSFSPSGRDVRVPPGVTVFDAASIAPVTTPAGYAFAANPVTGVVTYTATDTTVPCPTVAPAAQVGMRSATASPAGPAISTRPSSG